MKTTQKPTPCAACGHSAWVHTDRKSTDLPGRCCRLDCPCSEFADPKS